MGYGPAISAGRLSPMREGAVTPDFTRKTSPRISPHRLIFPWFDIADK
jgi:hypothetical protein